MPWWAWWAGAGALLGAMPAAGQGGAGWPAAAPVEAFVPALRACLAAEAATAYATAALPQTEGAVLVLLRRGDGGALACRVAADGKVQAREALAAAPPDPAAPAFFLERRCVDARRLDAADGRVLGWLAYPAC